MSYVKIWVHLVFSTKNRYPLLSETIREQVHQHILVNCDKKGIFLQALGGYTDHLHCLISLNKDQTIADVVHQIKGESSCWINRHKLCGYTFAWQDDYFAVSVSESSVEAVVSYIKNQEEHHRKKLFSEEVEEFMSKFNFRKL